MPNDYAAYEVIFARTQLVLFMLGMGAGSLSLRDFGQVIKQPRSLLVCLAWQLLIVPFVAVFCSWSFGLGETPGIGIGLLLIALMPGGSLSKVFCVLGRGNLALSVAYSVIATLATLLTAPLYLRLLAADHVRSNFQALVDLVVTPLLLYLLLPLAVGMVVGNRAPSWRIPFARWCFRIGWVFVGLMVSGSLISGRIHPLSYGWLVPLAIISYCLLAQQLSMLPYYIFRWPRPDRLTIGIETTMRNVNLALLLYAELFPEVHTVADGVLFTLLFYGAASLFLGASLALNHRRLARRAGAAASSLPFPVS